MSPDPLVVTRFVAEDGQTQLVVYDDGSLWLLVPSHGLKFQIASQWTHGKTDPPSAE